MSDRLGNYLYTGMTQSGKTTLALEHLQADVAQTGRPSLIFDLMPAKKFMNLPHEKTVDQVLRKLYKRGEISGAVFTPEDLGDFDRILLALVELGRVHVLVDEIRWVGSRFSIRPPFTKAMRAWAQAGGFGLTFRLTMQRPQDIHDDVLALAPTVYAFRTDGVNDREKLWREFSFDREVLRTLPRGKCLVRESVWA